MERRAHGQVVRGHRHAGRSVRVVGEVDHDGIIRSRRPFIRIRVDVVDALRAVLADGQGPVFGDVLLRTVGAEVAVGPVFGHGVGVEEPFAREGQRGARYTFDHRRGVVVHIARDDDRKIRLAGLAQRRRGKPLGRHLAEFLRLDVVARTRVDVVDEDFVARGLLAQPHVVGIARSEVFAGVVVAHHVDIFGLDEFEPLPFPEDEVRRHGFVLSGAVVVVLPEHGDHVVHLLFVGGLLRAQDVGEELIAQDEFSGGTLAYVPGTFEGVGRAQQVERADADFEAVGRDRLGDAPVGPVAACGGPHAHRILGVGFQPFDEQFFVRHFAGGCGGEVRAFRVLHFVA